MKETVKKITRGLDRILEKFAPRFALTGFIFFVALIVMLIFSIAFGAINLVVLSEPFSGFLFIGTVSLIFIISIFDERNNRSKRYKKLVSIMSFVLVIITAIMISVFLFPGEITQNHKNCWESNGEVIYKQIYPDADNYLLIEEFVVFDEINISRMDTIFHWILIKDGYFRMNIKQKTIERYEVGALH